MTAATLAALVAAPIDAHAYLVTVQTANTNGTPFDAVRGALSGFTTINTSFTYTGPLNFTVGPPQNTTSAGDLNSTFFNGNGATTITSYTPGGTLPNPSNANFTNLSSFLASSGSSANYGYGSLYSFDLGALAAGTQLIITHDDGASLYSNNLRIDGGAIFAGPTAVRTDSYTLTANQNVVLYYARENGAPSVLNVRVPEPMSLALLGSGLVAIGFQRRKRG